MCYYKQSPGSLLFEFLSLVNGIKRNLTHKKAAMTASCLTDYFSSMFESLNAALSADTVMKV
jgi:hypothetical protein